MSKHKLTISVVIGLSVIAAGWIFMKSGSTPAATPSKVEAKPKLARKPGETDAALAKRAKDEGNDQLCAVGKQPWACYEDLAVLTNRPAVCLKINDVTVDSCIGNYAVRVTSVDGCEKMKTGIPKKYDWAVKDCFARFR